MILQSLLMVEHAVREQATSRPGHRMTRAPSGAVPSRAPSRASRPARRKKTSAARTNGAYWEHLADVTRKQHMNRYQLKAYLNFPARDMQELELVARAMRYVETNGTPIDSPIPFEFTQVEPADANSGWRVTLAFHSFTIERNEHAFRRVWSVVKGYV